MGATRKDIIALPHVSLRKKSEKVGIITDEIKAVIEDMKQATIDWENHRDHEFGVALAGVQINRLYKIIVIRNDFEKKEDKTFSVMINPKIMKLEGEPVLDFEGCLSIKDLYGEVPRYPKVKVKALDENGKEYRVTAQDFLARVLQHEIDHTNGIVYIDHIKDNPKAFFEIGEDGKLTPQDYDDIKNSDILWN